MIEDLQKTNKIVRMTPAGEMKEFPIPYTGPQQPKPWGVAAGKDGHIWFTVNGDAYFLRPGSELRLRSTVNDSLIGALRLVTGALAEAMFDIDTVVKNMDSSSRLNIDIANIDFWDTVVL